MPSGFNGLVVSIMCAWGLPSPLSCNTQSTHMPTVHELVTDEKSTLKVCKHCGSVFVAGRPNSIFCSGKCKNQYNVYKSRAKDKEE